MNIAYSWIPHIICVVCTHAHVPVRVSMCAIVHIHAYVNLYVYVQCMYVYCTWSSSVTVYMELSASWQFALKMPLVRFLIGGFEYCMERNPCLQSKWRTFNLAIFMRFAKLKPPPNIPGTLYIIHQSQPQSW